MRQEELSKLTPDQKRAKIAELLGLNNVQPDFLSDLNAMHEVEKALDTIHEIEFYMERLTDTCGGDTEIGKASFAAYFATAEQRANAFLLTKG